MIPNFDDDRVKYVEFIQNNNGIFDKLFTRAFIKNNNSYMNLDSRNISDVQEGYGFFKHFNLSDDADIYSLTEDLDDFNTDPHQTDINKIISTFQRFLKVPRVQREFKKRFNEKLLSEINEQRDKLEEKRSKARTLKRTLEIKDELLDIDYVPDFRPHSVKGKIVRNVGEEWERRNTTGGKKTKTKKNRKYKH
jgi:hypothetical protein